MTEIFFLFVCFLFSIFFQWTTPILKVRRWRKKQREKNKKNTMNYRTFSFVSVRLVVSRSLAFAWRTRDQEIWEKKKVACRIFHAIIIHVNKKLWVEKHGRKIYRREGRECMCVLFTPGTKVSDRRKEKSEVKKINKREEGSWFSLGDSPSYIHVHTHIDEHVFCSAMSQSHNSCLSLLLQLFFLLLLILLPLLFTSFIYLLYLVFPSHFSKKRKQNNKFTRNNRLRAACVSYVVANV